MRSQVFIYLTIVVIAVAAYSCDIYVPQTTYTFAVSKNDYTYNYMLSHIKPFLEQNGYDIKIIQTERVVDANRLVAEGKADLTFVNNVSSHIVDSLGVQSETLQTILPLTRRALLAFTREETPATASANEIFANKVIAVEKLGGEGHGVFEDMMSRARIKGTKFIQFQKGEYDVRMFFGSLYGKRATEMLDSAGWHLVSFNPDWIEFQTLTEPALMSVTLPALPGNPKSARITTLATDAVLVGSAKIGENAVYRLAETFFQKKMALVRLDPIYRSINESIDQTTLLYPLHIGTASYLRRDTPTFFERYADALALVLSMSVLIWGSVQAIRGRVSKVKKDRIDQYYLEFLDVRLKHGASTSERILLLDDLFQRAVVQMTNEKMDKGDFNIFSRLVQQEVTILRMDPISA
jgi:TRAP-type uncharacterized transport system substrate-binding protein